ncbi:uncharacterized protein LOC112180912 [Rosa chinensis]|uniref:uncharacterized protein LOC112180912 n=1 Tax=Rosa chinensis TaxID=74649 RepID=UPI000D0878E5|nr:uncharacterized protein LOC112180912 [Rosa chinensis]
MPPSLTLKNFKNLDLGKIDETNDSGLASFVAGLFAHSLSWKGSVIRFSVLKAPRLDVLKISMSPPQEIADGVSIWEWYSFMWYFQKSQALITENISDSGASETRLVKPSFWSHKPVEHEYAGGKQIMFSDLFPYLIASNYTQSSISPNIRRSSAACHGIVMSSYSCQSEA